MLRALEKRPISTEEIDSVFGKILKEIRTKMIKNGCNSFKDHDATKINKIHKKQKKLLMQILKLLKLKEK